MRLRYIYIKAYHALKDFSIDFTRNDSLPGEMRSYTLHLIVGVNGTGKSTLLRLLVNLFRRLRSPYNRNPDFGFRVSYQLKPGGDIISLTNMDDNDTLLFGNNGLHIRRTPEGQAEDDVPYALFDPARDSEYLPGRIIAFTTGSEQEWLRDLSADEQLDVSDDESEPFLNPLQTDFQEQLQQWYLHELPGSPIEDQIEDTQSQEQERIISSDFYFITTAQLPLVTLCGMLADMRNAMQKSAPTHEELSQQETTQQGETSSYGPRTWSHLQQVMQGAGIGALGGFSLRFHMNEDNLRPDMEREIKHLQRYAHHTIRFGADYLMVFDLSSSTNLPRDLLDAEGGAFNLFTLLARLQEPDIDEEALLQDVNLFLVRDYRHNIEQQAQSKEGQKLPLHTFKWLSDGEQSFLGRLCLMPLLRDTEALILLDEPEVHFNDYWKRQLVLLLDEALTIEQPSSNKQDSKDNKDSGNSLSLQHCHVLMTTHSSITLTDVPSANIILLKRYNGYTGKTLTPDLTTLGADPSDIITTIFEAESATGAKGSNYISHEIEVIQRNRSNPREQIEELERLRDNVGPGYWRYLIRRKIHWLEGQTVQSIQNGQKETRS